MMHWIGSQVARNLEPDHWLHSVSVTQRGARRSPEGVKLFSLGEKDKLFAIVSHEQPKDNNISTYGAFIGS